MPELTTLDDELSSSLDLNTLPRTGKKRIKPFSGFSFQQQLPQRSFIRICTRAKRVRFFRNGDQYFKGVWYAIALDRFRCFEALLEDLNRTLGDLVNLPHGVRYVFTSDGQKRVNCLDDLEDGESYVCSSNEIFKKIDYENAREPIWCYSTPKHSRLDKLAVSTLDGTPNLFEPNDFVYPKIITIIRNGVKPRRVIRLLLNKRTARSFGQVLSDVTVAVKLDTGAVRKLFSLEGNQLTCLADFFKENDDVFIACGNERMGVDDFFLDCEEYRFLYNSKYRPPNSICIPKSGLTPKTPPSSRRLISSKQQRNSARFMNGGQNRPSPVLRRKFLNQKNQRKLKPKQQCDSNDQSPLCTVSCLNVASPSCPPSYPLIIEDKFSIGRIIGDGNFAVVHECICRETKKPVALKVIDKSKCIGKEEIVENEVRLMRRLQHAHIVQLIDYWNLDEQFFLTLELIRGGDLFDSLISVRYYPEREASQMMHNLLSALDYLHEINIAHRDVKPENLLVYETFDGRKQLKLADFGLATVVEDVLYTVCGTPTYVSPEILAETGYGVKVDIWAAGVIMYIMLCGFPPFVSMSNSQEELFESILSGEYNFPKPYWNHVSNAAKSLIQGMLQFNADDRYSAAEVLVHPWITGEAKVDPEFEELSSFVTQEDLPTSSHRRRSSDLDSNYEFYYSRRRSMDELSSVSRDYSENWRFCDNGSTENEPEDCSFGRKVSVSKEQI